MSQEIKLPRIYECECGATPIAKYECNRNTGVNGWMVMCPDCLLDLARPCATENRAIHRWNQRIID